MNGGAFMITRQHAALFAMQLASRLSYDNEGFKKQFIDRIPFVLLPDAIRGYVGPRQMSHFERTPNTTGVSWMEFPSAKTLKELSKETAGERIRHNLAWGYMKCVIGEDTSLNEFDRHNYGHRHYHDLRIHMLQDICLDRVLREEMVDVTHRFDDRFVVHHNRSITLDGSQLREQIALFEEMGFIYLCGKVHESTGLVLDGDWFDQYVLKGLKKAYPEDLTANTYKYIKFSPELDQRIKSLDFEISSQEREKVIIAEDLIATLDMLYSEASWYTYQEL